MEDFFNNHGPEIMLSMVTGLISGVISSVVFFWIISTMKPKLKICSEICKGEDEEGVFYAFKVVNASRYNVLDLKAEVTLKTPFNSNGGPSYSNTWMNLRKSHILLLPKYNKSDNHADYALVLATRDDIELLWTDPAQYMEFRVHGKHSFSGISKSFIQKFYTKRNCVKDGMFNFGNNFDIS